GLVGDSDAAFGPVQPRVGECEISGLVGQPMDHDTAARAEPPGFGKLAVARTGVRNVDGFVEPAVVVTPIKHVLTFRRAAIALVELVSNGVITQGNTILPHRLTVL